MSGYYLGLDGGGTKTAACILDNSLRELGRGAGGPCNIATGSLDTLRDSVQSATRQALAAAGLPPETRFESVCAGVAGYTAKRRRAEFLQLLPEWIPANHFRLEPDFVIAWWGATEGKPGIIVSAGTGAVVYGKNQKGESCRRDGRGFLLGDYGSGFWIGQQALMHTLRSADATRRDALSMAIMDAVGAADSDDIIEWVYRDVSPARIAALSQVVGELARRGDSDSSRIINRAAVLLRDASREVADALSLERSTPVYAIGNLWRIGHGLTDQFRAQQMIFEHPLPEIDLLEPAHDAAYGAALLAMQADGDA